MTPKCFLVVRDDAPDSALRGAVVAMGNFDGVHRGHEAVIAVTLDRARSLGKPAAVLTFEPHPRAFFNPGEPLFRLTDERAKLRLLASTGLDGAIILTFDAALAGLTAEEFVGRILVGRFNISGAVIGFNFHFGKNRAGSPDVLAAQGRRAGGLALPSMWWRRLTLTAVRSPRVRSVPRLPPGGRTKRRCFSAFRGSCRAR
jgi:riboflavin kinase/FMN adenylyltransferase